MDVKTATGLNGATGAIVQIPPRESADSPGNIFWLAPSPQRQKTIGDQLIILILNFFRHAGFGDTRPDFNNGYTILPKAV